ncbi:hypothetical protein [Azohydromonas aeria]|uniref:hypothetical protein n=1 Tax=Azohydromonas aeria TaxID=2590212 RepID=UPI0012F96B29|nr:hypothetical protein [Azohydromonas aeria]
MPDIAKLQEFDFVTVFDASGSTSDDDCPGGMTRWDFMQETALAFTREIGKIDQDGLGVVIGKGSSPVVKDGVTARDIKELLASYGPGGSTPLHTWLQAAFTLAGKSSKKDLIAVFFDGTPDDKAAVERVLIEQSNKQESDDALTVLFVQIGYDSAAKAWLQQLDDGLTKKGAKFDIVDTATMDDLVNAGSAAELILKAIAD